MILGFVRCMSTFPEAHRSSWYHVYCGLRLHPRTESAVLGPHNKIKSIIEQVGLDILASDEKDWAQEILWFWYHHAVSSAIWGHNDKAAAQKFSAQALAYQPEGHPNQITKLLYLLAYDHVDEAKAWALTISDDAEKATAQLLIAKYERGEILH